MTMSGQLPAANAARRAMIDSQLRTSGVNEPWVLAAMARVPREEFVPEAARLPPIPTAVSSWAAGASSLRRWFTARCSAKPPRRRATRHCWSAMANGYLAALLRPLVGSLDCVEPAEAAAKGKKGAYSLIVIDGAIERLPDALAASLADDGRLVTGLVERGITRLAAGRKAGGEVALLPLAELGIPVLPQFAAPKGWSF